MEPSPPHTSWPEDAPKKNQGWKGWKGWPWAALRVQGEWGVGCWTGGAVRMLTSVPPPLPPSLLLPELTGCPRVSSLQHNLQAELHLPPGLGSACLPSPPRFRAAEAPRGARVSGEHKERRRPLESVLGRDPGSREVGVWGGGSLAQFGDFFQQKKELCS